MQFLIAITLLFISFSSYAESFKLLLQAKETKIFEINATKDIKVKAQIKDSRKQKVSNCHKNIKILSPCAHIHDLSSPIRQEVSIQHYTEIIIEPNIKGQVIYEIRNSSSIPLEFIITIKEY